MNIGTTYTTSRTTRKQDEWSKDSYKKKTKKNHISGSTHH